jgi:hypothetical protein
MYRYEPSFFAVIVFSKILVAFVAMGFKNLVLNVLPKRVNLLNVLWRGEVVISL